MVYPSTIYVLQPPKALKYGLILLCRVLVFSLSVSRMVSVYTHTHIYTYIYKCLYKCRLLKTPLVYIIEVIGNFIDTLLSSYFRGMFFGFSCSTHISIYMYQKEFCRCIEQCGFFINLKTFDVEKVCVYVWFTKAFYEKVHQLQIYELDIKL